ncbi:cyclin-like F-box [Hypoxylon sp. FL1150]|nr:cyclin-like F-box [Hypoxylon sp. FL1150]
MAVGGNGLARKVSCVLDLPDEILKEICKNCHQSDWVSLSLVCKRFRDFAASLLYRHFHIVFPDEDDPCYDSPIDSLAGGLHTFTTSDYDYAKYLREISLETLSIGKKAEIAYKPYQAILSCGKFMNTLILLTLRKAQSLETFKWNIRVELDKLIYKTLHGIKTLRHLHIRLQEGPPLYKTPPPLPYPAAQYPGRLGALASSTDTKSPPTIAAFRNLETLSVLDIDSLDIITEIKACIRNSSSSLRKLKLSFSNNLAMQARGPADPFGDDEDEDDLQVLAPAAEMKMAERERKVHESVLARIFEVEFPRAKKIQMPAEVFMEDEQGEEPQGHPSREGQRFIDEVTVIFSRMVTHFTGTDDFRLLEEYDGFKTIVRAAKKYVDETDARTEPRPSIQAGAGGNEEDEPSLHLDENDIPESLLDWLYTDKDYEDGVEAVEAKRTDMHARKGITASEKQQLLEDIHQYTRDTRGLSLDSLSIYLIPIKASVLGKAIDLHSLTRITLLNVGEQKRFWTLMMKENKLKPLPLLKIFTDDVSSHFLQLVAELDRATEVFMLRRSLLHQPGSLAPTREITIEQIRKFVFKKHLPTLRRLMIKNEDDDSWDIDTLTMRLICMRGQKLRELAVSMGMAAMHSFIQNMGSLAHLRALQVVTFRADDICLSVIRETRHFIVDAICHNPGVKLEWLAFGEEGHATRIVRKQKVPKPKSASKRKEPIDGSLSSNSGGTFPMVPISWDPMAEEEDDEFDLLRLPEIELMEGYSFYDVDGIRIFKKEVVGGIL